MLLGRFRSVRADSTSRHVTCVNPRCDRRGSDLWAHLDSCPKCGEALLSRGDRMTIHELCGLLTRWRDEARDRCTGQTDPTELEWLSGRIGTLNEILAKLI